MFENVREDFRVYAILTGVKDWQGIPFASFINDARRFVAAVWMFPFSAVLLYRLKCWLRDHHLPVLPRMVDWLNMLIWRVQIADSVTIGPGLCISHGDVMMAGEVKVGRNLTINPWSGFGLIHRRKVAHEWDRMVGPTVGDNVFVGVGSRAMGPITIGDNVRIGANSVVIRDVPADSFVAGVPARILTGDEAEIVRLEEGEVSPPAGSPDAGTPS